MKRILAIVLVLCLVISPSTISAKESGVSQLKAAFIRDGSLWIKMDGKELQITDNGKAKNPAWSPDGKWILYQNVIPTSLPGKETQTEIWAYHLEKKEFVKIFYDGEASTWAPNQNIIAFKDEGVLDVSDLHRFYNAALGVDHYSWLPDGQGFVASSSGELRPDGWTNPVIYKIPLNQDIAKVTPNPSKVTKLITIPSTIQKGKIRILSINATALRFSNSGKWISFIISPTASWSMDSNMLTVISADGSKLKPIDEVIFGVGEPKWAPTINRLAYIAGGGRIVLGFKNKKLKVIDVDTSKVYSLTPKGFAALDFTWVNDYAIIVSRVKEAEWSNNPMQQPLPALYLVDLKNKLETKLSTPNTNKGDYNPRYLVKSNRLIWMRASTIIGSKDVWIANVNGKEAEEWIKNVDEIAIYDTY